MSTRGQGDGDRRGDGRGDGRSRDGGCDEVTRIRKWRRSEDDGESSLLFQRNR